MNKSLKNTSTNSHKGDSDAQFNLAYAYQKGESVSQDGGKANTKIEARVEIQTPTTYKNQLRNNIFLVKCFHFNYIQLS